MCISRASTSLFSAASSRKIRRNSPSENSMMFALWPSVMDARPCDRANSNAKRTIRRAPVTEMGFTVTPASFRISWPNSSSFRRSSSVSGAPRSNSIPAYRSSVFSLMTTRSTSGWREGMPRSERDGRTAANRSSSCRSATFTLRNPTPTGVVIGPLSATRVRRMESKIRSGSGVPSRARAAAPASSTAHSNPTPVASMTRRVASETSGPMPSPGIRVTRCATAAHYRTIRVGSAPYASREGKGGLRIRRSIALVLAASLFLVMAEQAQAATVDISIVSASAGFDSKAAAGAFADTFRWTNNDTITHTTTQKRSALAVELWPPERRQLVLEDDQLRRLVPLPPRHPLVDDGHHQGAAPAHPPSGSPDTTFAIAVASVAPPSGSVYDIQRKKGSGDWTAWRTGITFEVRKVHAEGVGNMVVPVAPAQDVERREERLVPARSISVM